MCTELLISVGERIPKLFKDDTAKLG